MKTLTSKKTQLMSETVYQSLREIIVGRRFEPGQRINVEELARELGVSRTPVWEAIRRLGQEGILKNIPNRGVFMADKPLERVQDIVQVRVSLDRLACRLAAGRVNRRMIEKLLRCLPDQLKAIEKADVASYYAADIRFHRLICEAAGNSYLKALYESITTHVFPTHFDVLALLPSLYVIHQEILAGFSDRDPERVDQAITRHGDLLLDHLKEQVASEAKTRAMVRRIKKDSPSTRPTLRAKSTGKSER
ncbi:MAG: GntR family transcriptional regulator [Desulfobacteraceae bacterium]|nr:MAG: GntR family transcriptional regulator [Desulfobacteraceae bacterium]